MGFPLIFDFCYAYIMTHGKASTYTNYGCRCELCKEAIRLTAKKRRASRGATLAGDDPRHGTLTGYNSWGCRCERCREATRVARAERYAKFQSAQVEGPAPVEVGFVGFSQQ